MAGTGRTPKENRHNPYDKPGRGDWKSAPGIGWQHGDTPEPPDGLTTPALIAWRTWMGAWYAAFWTPEDLPALRQMVRVYDQVERGEFQRAAELRLQFDTWGITPKGQQDRRWKPPAKEDDIKTASKGTHYGHLRVAGED